MAQAEAIPTTSRRRFLSILGFAGAATASVAVAVKSEPADSRELFKAPTEYLLAMQAIGWTPRAMFHTKQDGAIIRMGVNEAAPDKEFAAETWSKFHAIQLRCPIQRAADMPQGDWWKEVWQFLYDRGLREDVTPAVEIETADWDALETEFIAALAPLNELDAKIKEREDAFERWKARYPWPVEPEYSSHNERIADFKRFQKAEADHNIRYQNALIQCGFGKLKKARNDAYDAAYEVAKRIASTPVANLADVRAKSRISKHESPSGPIRYVLIKELRNI